MIPEAFLILFTILATPSDIPVGFASVTPVATWDSCQEQKASINKQHNISDVRWQCAKCVVNPFQQ